MEQIIEARIGKKSIGFADSEAGERKDWDLEGGLMQYVEPEDLQRYGLIPEIVGRLPVSVHLDELDEEALSQDSPGTEERAREAIPDDVRTRGCWPHLRR